MVKCINGLPNCDVIHRWSRGVAPKAALPRLELTSQLILVSRDQLGFPFRFVFFWYDQKLLSNKKADYTESLRFYHVMFEYTV